ncbi:MAG: protein kinase [Pirellulales bacterium]
MAAEVTERDPIDLLAEEYIERVRRGESPSVAEYTTKHPEWAEAIKELFPTIAAIERTKSDGGSQRTDEPARLRSAMPEKMGDFLIVREIGRGGMGVVFEAEQTSLGRRVALKVFPQHAHLDTGRFARFEREAQTAAQLHHTNIVPVFGVGEYEGLHYYVMQYIHGVGLEQVIAQLAQTGKMDGETQTVTADTRSNHTGAAANFAYALVSGSYVDDEKRTVEFNSSAVGSKPQPPMNQPSRVPPTAAEAMASDHDLVAAALGDVRPRLDHASKPGAPFWKSIAELGVQLGSALHYAHGQGTLHRDIKPANVILDYAGTAWLTDFGLAKAVEQDDFTTTGKVLGTLRYMSPEQLQGKAEPRSDIYSLGLTLYELATLQPAFGDESPKSLVEAMSRSEPTRPRKINPELPADLETIILKAIRQSPAERYSTANELVEDLQNFLGNQPIKARRSSAAERLWKWSRRNPAVAALSVLAVGLLALTSIVASAGYFQAVRHSENLQTALDGQTTQRERAEANSELALNVLDRIYEQFAPRRFDRSSELTVEAADGDDITVAVQPALSKDTAAVLEGLLKFYDQLADQEGPSETLRRKSASANRRVGDIRSRMRQTEKAESAYRRALNLYEHLAEKSPADVGLQIDIARVHKSLGSLHRSAKKMTDADDSFSKALSVLQNAVNSDQRSPEVRYELASTYYLFGRRQQPTPGEAHRRRPHHRGPHGHRPPINEEHLIQAVFLLEELTEESPKEPEYQFLLACCYRDLSPPFFAEAIGGKNDYSTKANLILEKLVNEYPEVSDYGYELAKSYSGFDIHDPGIRRGETDERTPRLEKALRYAQKLVSRHPGVVDYTILKATIHHKLGTMLRWSERTNEAETHFRQAVELLSQTSELSSSYQAQLTLVQQSLARVLLEGGRLEEAVQLLESSISHFGKIEQASVPETTSFDGIRGTSYRILSEAYHRLGRDQESEDARLEADKYGKADRPRPPRFDRRPDQRSGGKKRPFPEPPRRP